MRLLFRAGVLAVILVLPAGCTTTGALKPSPPAAPAPATESAAAAVAPESTAATPAGPADEEACLAAVARAASGVDLNVVSSETAEGGAVVVVEGVVDAEKSRWECVMSAGKVAGIVPVALDDES